MSDSLRPHGLWNTRLPSPSTSPRVCSDSCPFNQRCYLTISSSAVPFSFCLPSFPASGSFPMSQLFASGAQNICSFSIRPSNDYLRLASFRIDWFDLIAAQGTLKSLLQHHNFKTSILWCLTFFMDQLSYLYVTTGKTIDLTIWIFVSKVISWLFNMLATFVIAFLPRSKLQSPSRVILEPKKMKSVTASIFSDSICHEVMRPDVMILDF